VVVEVEEVHRVEETYLEDMERLTLAAVPVVVVITIQATQDPVALVDLVWLLFVILLDKYLKKSYGTTSFARKCKLRI
jgi:hypothetical protein